MLWARTRLHSRSCCLCPKRHSLKSACGSADSSTKLDAGRSADEFALRTASRACTPFPASKHVVCCRSRCCPRHRPRARRPRSPVHDHPRPQGRRRPQPPGEQLRETRAGALAPRSPPLVWDSQSSALVAGELGRLPSHSSISRPSRLPRGRDTGVAAPRCAPAPPLSRTECSFAQRAPAHHPSCGWLSAWSGRGRGLAATCPGLFASARGEPIVSHFRARRCDKASLSPATGTLATIVSPASAAATLPRPLSPPAPLVPSSSLRSQWLRCSVRPRLRLPCLTRKSLVIFTRRGTIVAPRAMYRSPPRGACAVRICFLVPQTRTASTPLALPSLAFASRSAAVCS